MKRSVAEPGSNTLPFVEAVNDKHGAATQQRPEATFRSAGKDLGPHLYPALRPSKSTDGTEPCPLLSTAKACKSVVVKMHSNIKKRVISIRTT